MNEGDTVTIPSEDGALLASNRSDGLLERAGVHALVSSFLANVTNEFRTPLAALNACVEYLLGDLESLSTGEVRQLLQSIYLSVTGLQTLVDNLIESSNIDAGRFVLKTSPIDIGAVICEAIRFVRPLTNRRRQQIVVEQAAPLPMVEADPFRLAQVMVNLLSNASRYGPMNQTICVSLGIHGVDQVKVSIAVQTPAFQLQEQEKLFERTSHDPTPVSGPYGVEIGISVARTIIEAHGGKAGIGQQPGDGSIYWFTIPTGRRPRGV